MSSFYKARVANKALFIPPYINSHMSIYRFMFSSIHKWAFDQRRKKNEEFPSQQVLQKNPSRREDEWFLLTIYTNYVIKNLQQYRLSGTLDTLPI